MVTSPQGDSAWCVRAFGQLRIPGIDVGETDKCGEGCCNFSPKKLQNLHTPQLARMVNLDSVL